MKNERRICPRSDGKLPLVEVMIEYYENNAWAIDYENNDRLNGKETLVWNDLNTPRPSDETLEQLRNQLQTEWDNAEYQRQRKPEYPNLADFADAYYWAQQGDNTKMNEYLAKIQAVKDKYPKG